jgi:glycosyltransferase involved in cell wall biosynthesis/SAM-dependent methyltransferase
MDNEQIFYNQTDIWDNAPEPYQVQMQADILSLLPSDISSVLDVGCGDGYITNALPKSLKVVGIDISQEALRHVQGETRVGSITEIPFPDNSFDLVMANDILEHLSDSDFDNALQELQRVATKYLLITVPLNEQLEANYTKCANCGWIYHINHHVRNFTEQSFQKILYNNFQPVEIRLSGGINVPPHDPTVSVCHNLDIYQTWVHAVCPQCHSKKQVEFDDNSTLMRIINAQRTVKWTEHLITNGIWNDRSEIIGLFSITPDAYTPKFTPNLSCETRDILSIDFSNPLQIAQNDFISGSFLGKYTLPAEAELCEDGLMPSHPLPNGCRIPIRIQVKPKVGDQILITASGNSEEDIFGLYTVDGLICKAKLFCQSSVTEPNQKFTLMIEESWGPDKFGWALDLYLYGQVKIHNLQYISHQFNTIETDFLKLEAGHNVIGWKNQNVYYSWGLLVKSSGFYPEPQLKKLFSQHKSQIIKPVSTQKIFSAMETVFVTLNQKNNQLIEQLSSTQEQIDVVNSRLETKERERASAEAAYDASCREYKILSEQLSTTQQQLSTTQQQLSTTQQQLSTTQQQLSTTQQQLHSLQGAWGSSRELLRSIKRKKTWTELLRHIKRLIWWDNPIIETPKEYYPSPPWNQLEKLPEIVNGQLRVLVLSHMFPHPTQPILGSFVLEQVKALRQYANVDARVLIGRPFWMSRCYSPVSLFRGNRAYFKFHNQSYWQEIESVPVMYIPYRVIPYGFWTHGWFYRQSMVRGIEQIYRDFPFQIVHAHTSYLDGSAACTIAKRFKVPMLITEHTGPFTHLTKNPIVRWWTKRSLKNAQKIIAVSTAQKNNIAPYLAKNHQEKLEVIYNGVDTNFFYPPKQWTPNPKNPNLVFVGSYEPIKNLPILFKAVAKIRQQIPKISLTIIGEAQTPKEKEQLEILISQLALNDCIKLLGRQNRENVARIIREKTDILVLPSKAETFGCVLAEALASGKPVVATQCGGPEDIITEKFVGRLAKNNDVDDLTRALMEVIENLDTFSLQRIQKYAEEWFGFESISQKIENVYKAILKEKN